VPRGLTPRVTAVRLLRTPPYRRVQLRRGLKTSIRSNCRQLRGNATPLKIRAFGVMRRVLSGGVEPPTLTDTSGCSGVNSSRPIPGRSRGIKFACVRPFLGDTDKPVKPRSLSPRYFTLLAFPGHYASV
jgi:hypothetical protein